MNPFETVKKFLTDVNIDQIKFKKHFYDRILERPISESMIKKQLKKTDNLLKAEEQPARNEDEKKYKLWIKLSNRYSLVIIAVISKKDLYIVSGWNTDRKWQRTMQK